MLRAFVRGIRHVLNAAFAGTTVLVLMLGLSALEASAAEEVTAALNATPAVAKRVVVVRTMAPIPDADEAGAATSSVGVDTTDAPQHGEAHCLATAIYFEARGESFRGQRAVAEVILARTRVPGRPKTVCGVVYEGSKRKTGCQFSFTCDRIPDVVRAKKLWARAQRVAAQVMRTRGRGKTISRGATFYHADYVNPDWAARMVKVAQIGQHIFYRPKRGHLF
jgi:spore germination cell wall hydrolase CwlJ-like protein